jgi:hypothetical protein
MTKLLLSRGNTLLAAELVTFGETAAIAGLTKSRLAYLHKHRRPKYLPFPQPIEETALGPFWHRPDVVGWREERDRRHQAEKAERERRRREVEERFALEPTSYEMLLDQAAGEEDWRAMLDRIAAGGSPSP